MMTNADSSLVGRALRPWVYMADDSAAEACRSLRELIVEGRDPETYVSSRSIRYWPGYVPVLSVLLVFLKISSFRKLLRILEHMAVIIPLLFNIKDKRFLLLTAPISIAGAFFWGLQYFGDVMSHAMDDYAVTLGMAGLVFWHRKFTTEESLTFIHAGFMARILIVSICLGWASALWQLALKGDPDLLPARMQEA